MILDKEGNRTTPRKAAKGIFLAFGNQWTSMSFDEFDTYSGIDCLSGKTTEREKELIYDQLHKISWQVQKYLRMD
jgi:hypothetical protein